MLDWDDVRFFLSVEASGSTLGASNALKTSQSTVFRRITQLEERLGVTLFDRRASGYSLTQAGANLLPAAKQIEAAVATFEQAAALERRSVLTTLRFSAPDAALDYMLPIVMAEFRKRYPDIKLEVLASPKQLDLASGEADVALRANPTSDPDLFGRRLVEEKPCLTASRTYAAVRGLPQTSDEFAQHDFIAPAGMLATLLSDWFEAHVPNTQILLQPDSIPSALAAAKSDLGLAILPQFIVDREPNLIAAPIALPIPSFDLWVLTHRRLRRSAPVKALMDIVANYIIATAT